MTEALNWELLRRQVAMGGIVTDATGLTVNGARLCVQRKNDDIVRAERLSGLDGSFYFMDLTDGEYIVTASAASGTGQGQCAVGRDESGTLNMVWLDLRLENRSKAKNKK